MSLTLSHQEVAAISASLKALLSPFEYANAEAWRADVIRRLLDLSEGQHVQDASDEELTSLLRTPEIRKLLLPALKSGTEWWQRQRAEQDVLINALDATSEGLILFDGRGKVVHQTPAYRRMMEDDAWSTNVDEAVRHTVRFLREDPDGPAARTVESGETTYAVSGRRVGARSKDGPTYILISVSFAERLWPGEDVLQERFGLSKQETRVARLLAERKTNDEIATELFISPHTTRRHTERVLFKLDVESRKAVRDVLLRVRSNAPDY